MAARMPGVMKILPVFCLFISLAVPASEPVEESETDGAVRIVSGPHYPPFSSENLPQNGLGPFLVAEIFEAAGQKVVSDFRPWKRAYRETLQRKYDAALPYTETKPRRQDFRFSKPVFRVNSFIFVRSDSPITAQSLAELKGKTYCNPLGFADGRPIERMELDGELTRISPSTLENCFKMLAAGRVDFIKTNPHVAQYMSGNYGFSTEQFRALNFIVETASLHVIVARDHPAGEAIIETFNQNYTRMRKTGRIAELAEAYLEGVKAAAGPMVIGPAVTGLTDSHP